jgi:heme/copper-type cytochrome/quinol oxidase subunit 1
MTPMKWLTAVLVVLGLIALVAAIIYFTVAAQSLPTFLGPLHHVQAHRKRRGEAVLALAIVLWAVAAIIFFVERRSLTTPSTTSTTDQPAA